MDKRFKKLEDSIMFTLSRSSMELFHSNFLKFLFISDGTLFGKIVGIKNLTTKEVKREYKNIDIEITGVDGKKKYLIENKVKDIIDSEQLERIETKNKNYEKYYLFSLLGDNLEKVEEKHPLWKEVGYEHIIAILKEHRFNDKTIESYKKGYCAFMTDMISLLKEHYHDCNEYLLFKNGKKNEKTLHKQYEEVGLHDVFQKYGVSHFVNYFRKKYGAKIKSDYGYIRNGIMTFSSEEMRNKNYSIEIQIEDGKYRKCIVGPEKDKEKLQRKFESLGWFDKNWMSPHKLKYKSYDHKDEKKTFRWYQEPNDVKNWSYNDLAKKIKTDLDEINIALKGSKDR